MMPEPTNTDARSTAESRREQQPSNDSVKSNSPGYVSFITRLFSPSSKHFILGGPVAAAAQDQSPTQQTAGGSPTVNAGSSAHESLSGPGLDEHSVSIASRRSKRDKQHRHGAQRLHRGDDELEVSSSQIRESARGVTNPVTSQPAVNLQRHGVPTTISCETVYSEDNTLYTSASAAIIRKLQLDVQAAEAKAKAAEEAAKVAQDEAKAAKEEATVLTAISSSKPTMNNRPSGPQTVSVAFIGGHGGALLTL